VAAGATAGAGMSWLQRLAAALGISRGAPGSEHNDQNYY
jgi:hypothetical protein